MSYIVSIHARQILDSRGNPTVEADVTTDKGHCWSRKENSSGASTGTRSSRIARWLAKHTWAKACKKQCQM